MHPEIISVDSLPAEGRTFTLRLTPADVNRHFGDAGLAGVRAIDATVGEMRVLPSGDDVFVLGALRASVQYDCVRCLNPFEDSVEVEFHLTFARQAEDLAGGELELRREDLDLEIIEGGVLDLSQMVLEQLDLALKPHPVCREECRGLCPQCGVDRNQTACECQPRATDPRLAALERWARKDRSE